MDAKSVAIVDPDAFYRGRLAAAVEVLGVPAAGYGDAAAADVEGVAHAGYVLCLAPPAAKALVRQLRRRGRPAILLLSDGARLDAMQSGFEGGPAQHVTKFKAVQDVAACVVAAMTRAWPRGGVVAWQLDRRARQLVAPDGARIDLSVDEVALLACFVLSAGSVISREAMAGRLPGTHTAGLSDAVHATMLRLQRRAERLTPMSLPFHAWARTGYSFHGHLEEA